MRFECDLQVTFSGQFIAEGNDWDAVMQNLYQREFLIGNGLWETGWYKAKDVKMNNMKIERNTNEEG